MKQTTIICIISSLVITIFTGCTSKRAIGDINSDLKSDSLEANIYAQLVYFPNTVVNISESSEFFADLRNDEAYYYEHLFINQLDEHNIGINNDYSRFIVTVNSIAFIERTNTECAVANPRTGQEQCFLLNRLTITISITILDRVSNKSRSCYASVSESTRIKSRIIGRDIRESEFRSASDNILETMTNHCFKECASKSAKRINKFIKKYG
jgi:hypothetical protein